MAEEPIETGAPVAIEMDVTERTPRRRRSRCPRNRRRWALTIAVCSVVIAVPLAWHAHDANGPIREPALGNDSPTTTKVAAQEPNAPAGDDAAGAVFAALDKTLASGSL